MAIKEHSVVTCLYCEDAKTPEQFNREHVLPEAFGKYENNHFVLRGRVCRECNSYFGTYLDGPLARDSKEGLDRFVHGGVEPKKDRKLRGTRLKLKRNGGRFDGALLQWTLDATGTHLTAKPAPQLGFANNEDGPYDWCPLNDLPSPEVLRSKQFSHCVAGGMSNEDATALVKRLGFDGVLATELVDPPAADGMVATTTEGRIDQTLRRAVAKIAFNYFAYRYSDIATLGHFRDIRRYIRFCEEPSENPVTVSTDRILGGLAPDVQIVGHIITTKQDLVVLDPILLTIDLPRIRVPRSSRRWSWVDRRTERRSARAAGRLLRAGGCLNSSRRPRNEGIWTAGGEAGRFSGTWTSSG
jgi:hypothetical protein